MASLERAGSLYSFGLYLCSWASSGYYQVERMGSISNSKRELRHIVNKFAVIINSVTLLMMHQLFSHTDGRIAHLGLVYDIWD